MPAYSKLILPSMIFDLSAIGGFLLLTIMWFYDFKIASILTMLMAFSGIKFLCILITRIHGTLILGISALLALVVIEPIFDNTTFISLILISVCVEYTVISISLKKIGINNIFSNLSLTHMLKIIAFNALLVSFFIICGLILMESPPVSVLFDLWIKVLVIKFLSPLMLFRALSLFH
jgi:hypothetical protein